VTATNVTQSLNWKLRRIAAAIRQQDIALRVGMSTTRYSAIERGARVPSKLETELIDKFLPQLPVAALDPDRVEPCNGGVRLLQAALVGR
jgi:transcriptional regulator with XRE-family HTH domain